MAQDLTRRSEAFAACILRVFGRLHGGSAVETIVRQLVRSATSVGANYRAAQCARSHNEFIAKLQIVREEADETQYWLRMLQQVQVAPVDQLDILQQEARELTAIFTAALKTARRNQKTKPPTASRNSLC